jgi:hypothetical protein
MSITVFALIAALAGPVAGTGQAPEGPLASARTLRCSFSVYATAQWVEPRPEVLVDEQDFSFEIDEIDIAQGRATIVASGSALATMVVSPTGLNVIEQTPIGNINLTTVFAAGGNDDTFLAVHSRHLGDVSAWPRVSQSYGTCELVR